MAHLSRKLTTLFSSCHRFCVIDSTLCRVCCQNVRHTSSANAFDSSLFTNILSDENKRRVQSQLAQVQPARTVKHISLHPNHGAAAVLVPLCTVNKEPSLLLTLRSRNLTKYRGQVSFPGGMVDDSDPDFEYTALRETEEELGMNPSVFEIWGRMNSLPTSSHNAKLVYPILAQTGEIDISKLKLSDDEVEEVFTVSIKHLCNLDYVGSTRFRSRHPYTLPVYTGTAHRIWGVTAIIIHMLLTIIVPDLYAFKLQHKHDKFGALETFNRSH